MKDNFLIKAMECIEANRKENMGLYYTPKEVIDYILKSTKDTVYFLPGDYIDW